MTIKRCTIMLLGISVIATQIIACGNPGSQDKTDNSIMQTKQSDIEKSSEDITDKKGDLKVSDEGTESGMDKQEAADDVDINDIYKAALYDFVNNHTFPDGSDCAYDESFGEMSDNTFAISDIDNDGSAELIINYITAPVSGQVMNVYDYNEDNGSISLELMEVPQAEFYSNGLVKAMWSHNQGLAGDSFWPYNLYKYNEERKMYELVASVDAWNLNYAAKDFNGNSFPKEIDKENAGIVYYVTENGAENIISKTDYDKWYNSYFSAGESINVSYVNLTKENIENVTSK